MKILSPPAALLNLYFNQAAGDSGALKFQKHFPLEPWD